MSGDRDDFFSMKTTSTLGLASGFGSPGLSCARDEMSGWFSGGVRRSVCRSSREYGGCGCKGPRRRELGVCWAEIFRAQLKGLGRKSVLYGCRLTGRAGCWMHEGCSGLGLHVGVHDVVKGNLLLYTILMRTVAAAHMLRVIASSQSYPPPPPPLKYASAKLPKGAVGHRSVTSDACPTSLPSFTLTITSARAPAA